MKYPHIIANVGLEKTSDKPNAYDVVNVTRRAIARAGYLREAIAFDDEAAEAYTKETAERGVLHVEPWRVALRVACEWCTVLVPIDWPV